VPLKPELITFDCAHTLLQVDWHPGRFAVLCAHESGLELRRDAADVYMGLYAPRHSQYVDLNLSKDRAKCEAFWDSLTADWLRHLGYDPDEWASRLRQKSNEIGFGPNSRIFKVFDDVLPLLDFLDAKGVKKAIISNWDYSLHVVLDALGLTKRFDLVVASLEEGFEKPDPRIFLQSLDKLGVAPENAVHVGDDAIDDLQGARNVGMRALLLDRRLTPPTNPPYISSLSEIPGALAWSV